MGSAGGGTDPDRIGDCNSRRDLAPTRHAEDRAPKYKQQTGTGLRHGSEAAAARTQIVTPNRVVAGVDNAVSVAIRNGEPNPPLVS
jgi:hypothetical protein